MKMIKNLLLIVAFLFFFSCSSDDSTPQNRVSNISTEQGNKNSNKLIVYMQGGPDYTLDPIDNLIEGSNTQDVLWVNVHQIQTSKPELFQSADITFDEAKEYASTNASNVDNVVKYYKEKGKKVYLVSVSYGSFVAADYVARFGVSDIEKALLLVGRLDMDEDLWKTFSVGNEGIFLYDLEGNVSITTENVTSIPDRNKNKLAAALGYKRYTQLWKDVSGLNKIAFVWGSKDERTGRLTESELEFIESKNIGVFKIEEATHNEAALEGLINLNNLFDIN
jgi:hypothetical protein